MCGQQYWNISNKTLQVEWFGFRLLKQIVLENIQKLKLFWTTLFITIEALLWLFFNSSLRFFLFVMWLGLWSIFSIMFLAIHVSEGVLKLFYAMNIRKQWIRKWICYYITTLSRWWQRNSVIWSKINTNPVNKMSSIQESLPSSNVIMEPFLSIYVKQKHARAVFVILQHQYCNENINKQG